MGKNWRPKGWKNPHNNMLGKGTPCDICFELGADAMLKALRKMGKPSLHSVDANNDMGFRLVRGKQVFIPD